MAHNVIKTAIHIYLDKALYDDAAIGLYEVASANSELRYSDSALAGVTKACSTGFLIRDTMSAISESADTTQGGCVATVSGFDFSIRNTNQLSIRLQELGVNLGGCAIERIEYIGTEADSDSVSATTVFRGEIESFEWTETECKISCVVPELKRRAILGSKSADGEADIPVTFGAMKNPSAPARMQRNRQVESILDNTSFFVGSVTPEGAKIFPVIAIIGTAPSLVYRIKMCSDSFASLYPPLLTDHEYCIETIDGTGKGQKREIESWEYGGTLQRDLDVTLKDYFETELEVSGATQTWVTINELTRDYKADVWPCEGFCDSAGTALADNLCQLYGYVAPKHIAIPPYAFLSSRVSPNLLSIDPKLYNADPDKIDSFLCLPLANFYAVDTAADLSTNWGIAGYTKGAESFFYIGDAITDATNVIGYRSRALDRDESTYFRHQLGIPTNNPGGGVKIAHFISAHAGILPAYPDDFAFDDLFFLVDATRLMNNTVATTGLIFNAKVKWRRFYGDSVDILDPSTGDKFRGSYNSSDPDFPSDNMTALIKDLPDFYYNTDTNKNLYFYPALDTSPALLSTIRSFAAFPITGIDTKDKYESIQEIFLAFEQQYGRFGDSTFRLDVRSIGIMFRKEIDISDFVSALVLGRTFEDTWGTRKTSANLIADPIDQLEHVCRLQNWSETGDSVDWGKAYSPSAMINTTSFDSAVLDPIKACRPAWQITKIEDSSTDKIKQDICQTFGLISRVDNEGYECVDYLHTTAAATETLAYNQIIPGSITPVIEPDPNCVYCNPVIKYAYDHASEKYTAELRVTNTDKSTWSTAYASGFANDTDAEAAWQAGRLAWNVAKKIQDMPSDLSELRMVSVYADALLVLQNRLAWMLKKRIGLSVPYEIGREWYCGLTVAVTLPHQTNAAAVRFMIETIDKDIVGNRCEIKFVILDAIESNFYTAIIQDSDAATDLWQDDDSATDLIQDTNF